MSRDPRTATLAAFLLAVGLFVGGPVPAQTAKSVGGTWQVLGPGPAINGQVENLLPDDEVVGAIHTVAAHPSNPGILYVGAVNGGIWKTTNATAASPTWQRQSDFQRSLSIGALEFDPTDGTHQTLVAGIGGYSSFGARGDRIGLLRTTNGGSSWALINGGGTLVGKNVSGVAPRGSTLVVSVNVADSFTYPNIGIFRSTNGGASFTQISTGDGSVTGLPGGVCHDLASDPSNQARLFTSVIFADGVGGSNGVYRSTNTGATWAKVSSAAMDALLTSSTTNVEIAVGPSDNVYAAIVNYSSGSRLAGIFRSGNGGTSWTAMDLPTTIEDGVAVGIHPGGQGSTHLSIEADPTDADIVYVGGDRQPYFSEFSGGSDGFPNSIGAYDYSGRIFRGNASLASGLQWTPLTHSGTASSSAPHADSREMAFDSQGNLIETDDGGIYKRTNPRSSSGDWSSIIGDLQSTEYHGVAYDSNAGIVIGGAQDTGSTEQLVPGLPTFFSVSTADGGDTAVDDHSTPGFSTRYSSFQFLGALRRRLYNSSNELQSQFFPSLTVLGGGAELVAQFYTPIAVNEVDGDRLIIAAFNSLYESLDQGETITEIAPGLVVNAFVGDPIVYGVPGNADLLYVAQGAQVFRRTAAPPASLTAVASPSGSPVNDLAIDPDNPSRVFAADSSSVYFSTSSGAGWSGVTGNLGTLDAGVLRTLAFVPGVDDALAVGTARGVFVAFESSGFSTWDRLGTGLPNAPVYELDYDAADDALVAGLAGRGAWKLQPATSVIPEIFSDGFESGNTSAWSLSVP